jgi:hypothetical protein
MARAMALAADDGVTRHVVVVVYDVIVRLNRQGATRRRGKPARTARRSLTAQPSRLRLAGAGCGRRGDLMAGYAWIISVIGNAFTLVGAFWTARAVILTDQQASAISSVPYGGTNSLHAAALLDQSKAAKHGL